MVIGIIGAGAMGSGIAQVASQAGHQVILTDTKQEVLDLSKSKLAKIMNRLVEKGRLTAEEIASIQNNITYTLEITDFYACGLVIEAVIERLDIKKLIFSNLESIVSESCILASNTSSLSIASIAASCNISSRVLGIHFFNPAPLMPLVEIIPAVQTDSMVLSKAKSLIDGWKKITVLAKDTPGFIVNRVARPFYSEALRIFEEGIADMPTIDWAMREIGGFRMGPFQLMDFIGNDVNYAVTESVWTAFYYDPRYKPSFTQKRYSEAGWFGRKSGKGYYNYGENPENTLPAENKELGKVIVDRIVAMLINEAADALFWNIASAKDIDLAMTKGVNYPKGLLKWANEIGLEKCINNIDNLQETYREDRYRCSPILRSFSNEGKLFEV